MKCARAAGIAGFVLLGLPACSRGKGSSAGESGSRREPGSLSAATTAGTSRADSGAREPGGATRLVHFLGRVDTSDPAGPRFSWAGTAIAATFRGTGLDLALHDSGTNSFAVQVDGGPPTSFFSSPKLDTYTLAANLAPGVHSVVVTKRTEPSFGPVQYLGLAVREGALVPSAEPRARTIEYVGDSVLCGYGILGANEKCVEAPETEDETIGVAALTAAALGAQQTVIAYSGRGAFRSFNGSTSEQVPVLFERTLADDPASQWNFSTPEPDVVVVHLGTNDFIQGDPGEAFEREYLALLRQIRRHYPDAAIVCTLSPMLGDKHGGHRKKAAAYIREAVRQISAGGDAHVTYFEFDEQLAADGFGCAFHPSEVTHRKMAARLERYIRDLTGW